MSPAGGNCFFLATKDETVELAMDKDAFVTFPGEMLIFDIDNV